MNNFSYRRFLLTWKLYFIIGPVMVKLEWIIFRFIFDCLPVIIQFNLDSVPHLHSSKVLENWFKACLLVLYQMTINSLNSVTNRQNEYK